MCFALTCSIDILVYFISLNYSVMLDKAQRLRLDKVSKAAHRVTNTLNLIQIGH